MTTGTTYLLADAKAAIKAIFEDEANRIINFDQEKAALLKRIYAALDATGYEPLPPT